MISPFDSAFGYVKFKYDISECRGHDECMKVMKEYAIKNGFEVVTKSEESSHEPPDFNHVTLTSNLILNPNREFIHPDAYQAHILKELDNRIMEELTQNTSLYTLTINNNFAGEEIISKKIIVMKNRKPLKEAGINDDWI